MISARTALILRVARAGAGDSLRVAPATGTIGRDPSADLVLPDPKVSGIHGTLERRDAEFRVVDARSFNGLWFDEVRVPSCPLSPERATRIGPFHLFLVAVTRSVPVVLEVEGEQKRQVAELPCIAGIDAWGRFTLDESEVVTDRCAIFEDADGFGVMRLGTERNVLVARPIDEGDETLLVGPLRVRRAAARDYAALPTDLAFDGEELVPRLSLADLQDGFPPSEMLQPDVSDAAIAATGLPVQRVRFAALGGGLGSFCFVDALRVHGVPIGEIAAIGFEAKPYGRYERLCRQSQIPPHERLRSNSESCPDNLWGFPGYAPREALRDVMNLRLGHALKTIWQIIAEPDLAPTYTPRAGDVFRAIDREANRIGWGSMLLRGRIRAVRKRREGGFVIAVSLLGPDGDRRRLVVADHIHLALGYPGLRFLDDLRVYRERTHDFQRVVNAYEDHEHVYERLKSHGGTVVLRGRGIVASRILQRLHEVRARHRSPVTVVHLMRSEKVRPDTAGLARRPVEHHWTFQPFNWPEAAWGGELRRRLLSTTKSKRQRLFREWGGTTTADRPDWRRIVSRGLSAGWYRIIVGDTVHLDEDDTGLRVHLADERVERADFVIDATGLIARATTNPVLDDLVRTYSLAVNQAGALEVDTVFRVAGLDSGTGRAFAAGVTCFGNHYAPVDSFLGLQVAAQVSLGELAVPGLTPERSVSQWLRWVRGVAP